MINKKNTDNDGYCFNEEEMTVTLRLTQGLVDCAIIVILTIQEKDYIALRPLDSTNDSQVWFYRYFEDEENPIDDPTLECIESEAEITRVAKAYDDFIAQGDDMELNSIEPAISDEDLNNLYFRGGFFGDGPEEVDGDE